jgi:CheY-like chemotaxis protein
MMGKRMPWHSTQRAAWETHNKRGQMMTQLGRRALLLVVLLLKHARALQGLPAKILVSGSPFTEVREVALAHGAFAFIPKPFHLPNLTGSRYSLLSAENAIDGVTRSTRSRFGMGRSYVGAG